MNTPIERLRQRHVAAGFPDNQCCVVLSCGLTWPCDTIAALDALEEGLHNLHARIDAATVLLNEALWLVGEGAYGDDVRAWLAGDKEEHGE